VIRPLRSVLIGDVDYYPSEYAFGVNQAMTRAGHWHTTVNIRADLETIERRVVQMRPDVIWGHMLLWAPGPNKTVELLCRLEDWRRAWGAKVLVHDGDARTDTRFPTDISPAVDLALCNHTADRSAWGIPQLHWPYFAFDQARLAEPVEEYRCDLAFAGRLDTGPLYLKRTELVLQLKHKLGDQMKIFHGQEPHTLYRTPELAASAGAVLGFGRPERNGWLDVRVFQYPGAGAVLLHDDVGGFLDDGAHYMRYKSGDVLAVLNCLDWLKGVRMQHGENPIRQHAFEYVQAKHSATVRVRQALAAVGLTL
jgi:hypothetical protein